MRKNYVIFTIFILLLATSTLAYSERGFLFDIFGFFKNSITGFMGFSGSPAGGMNLTVWDDSDTTTLYRFQAFKFYANLTNATDGSVIDDSQANVSIEIIGITTADMVFNSSSGLWELYVPANLNKFNGTFIFNVTATSPLYSPDTISADDELTILYSCLNLSIAGDDFIINQDEIICEEHYNISDNALDGYLKINASGIIVDCNNSLMVGDWSSVGFYVLSAAQNVLIKNCNMTNFTAAIFVGSFGTNAYNTTITNSSFYSNNVSIYYGNKTNIINNSFFDDIVSVQSFAEGYESFIYNNYFFECSDVCIKDSGFSNEYINNTIETANVGISMQGSPLRQNNSKAYGNLINNSMVGIEVVDANPHWYYNNHAQIINNIIDNADYAIIINGSTNANTSYNVITNAAQYAIYDSQSTNSSYLTNEIYDSYIGILTDNSTNIKIQETFVQGATFGAHILDSAYSLIENSYIYDSVVGIYYDPSNTHLGDVVSDNNFNNISYGALIVGISSNDFEIKNNDFFDNNYSIVISGGNHRVYNNKFLNSSVAIYTLTSSNNSIFYNNSIIDCYSDKNSLSIAIEESGISLNNSYENNSISNCNISIKINGYNGFVSHNTKIKGNSINLTHLGIFINDYSDWSGHHAINDVSVLENYINGADYAIYVKGADSTNITRNLIKRSYIDDAYLVNNSDTPVSNTKIWANSFITNGVNRSNDINTTFCVDGIGNFYTNNTPDVYIGPDDCGLPQRIGDIILKGWNISLAFTHQDAHTYPNYSLSFINSTGNERSAYNAGSSNNITIPRSFVIQNLSSASEPKYYNITLTPIIYASVHYGINVLLGNITLPPKNNLVCSNTSVCAYQDINEALDDADGTIYLVEENQTYTLDSNKEGQDVVFNASGITLNCEGKSINSTLFIENFSNIKIINCNTTSSYYYSIVANNSKLISIENSVAGLMLLNVTGANLTNVSNRNTQNLAFIQESRNINAYSIKCTEIAASGLCLKLDNVSNINITSLYATAQSHATSGIEFVGETRNLTLRGAYFASFGAMFTFYSYIYDSLVRDVVAVDMRGPAIHRGIHYRTTYQNITFNQTSGTYIIGDSYSTNEFVNTTFKNWVIRSTTSSLGASLTMDNVLFDNITAPHRFEIRSLGALSTMKNMKITQTSGSDCLSLALGRNISIQDSELNCKNKINYYSDGVAIFKNNTLNCSQTDNCFEASGSGKVIISNNTFINAGNSSGHYLIEGMRSYLGVDYNYNNMVLILKNNNALAPTNSTPIPLIWINGSSNMSMALVKIDDSLNITAYFESFYLSDCSEVCDYILINGIGGASSCSCDYYEQNVFLSNGHLKSYTPNFSSNTSPISGRPNSSLIYDISQLSYPLYVETSNSQIEGNTFKSNTKQEHIIMLLGDNNKIFNNNFLIQLEGSAVLDTGANNSYCVGGEGNFYEESLTPMTNDCGPINGTLGDQRGIISFSWKKQSSSKTVYYDIYINEIAGSTFTQIASGTIQNLINYDASAYIGQDLRLLIVPWINGSRYNGTHYLTNTFRVLRRPTQPAEARGGGGGAGAPIITKIPQIEVSENPVEIKLVKGAKLIFLYELNQYSLKLSDVSDSYAEIYIGASALTVGINERKAIDLDNDKKPDIIIVLKNFAVSRVIDGASVTEAVFEILKYPKGEETKKEVEEQQPIQQPPKKTETPPVPQQPMPTIEKPKVNKWFVAIAIVSIMVIVAIAIIVRIRWARIRKGL
ncbi:MAG: right-handed parallel beta-helix repeat-containing protein [Candidatus Woesearchaeota archaeon]